MASLLTYEVVNTAQPVQISSQALIKTYFKIEDEKCDREFKKMELLYKKKAYTRIEDKCKHGKKCQKMELLNEITIKDVLEDGRRLLYLQAGMKAIVTSVLLSSLNCLRSPTTLPFLNYIMLGVEICGIYLVGRDCYQIKNYDPVSRDCSSGEGRDRQDDCKCYNCGNPGGNFGHVSRDYSYGEDSDREDDFKCLSPQRLLRRWKLDDTIIGRND